MMKTQREILDDISERLAGGDRGHQGPRRDPRHCRRVTTEVRHFLMRFNYLWHTKRNKFVSLFRWNNLGDMEEALSTPEKRKMLSNFLGTLACKNVNIHGPRIAAQAILEKPFLNKIFLQHPRG